MPKIDICVKELHNITDGVINSAEMHYKIMAGEKLIHENELFGKSAEHHATFIIEGVPMDSLKLVYGCDSSHATLTASIVHETVNRISDFIHVLAKPIHTPIPCERVAYRESLV